MKKIIATIIGLLVAGIGWIFYEKPEPPFAGATVSAVMDGKTVVFAWTDDNTKENIIIRSDKKDYFDNDVYFSVENTTGASADLTILFTLLGTGGSDATILGITERLSDTKFIATATASTNFTTINASLAKGSLTRKTVVGDRLRAFTDTIPAGQTNFYKAVIALPGVIDKEEFFIEAFGSNGEYGHLD